MIQKALKRFARFILGNELRVLRSTVIEQESTIKRLLNENINNSHTITNLQAGYLSLAPATVTEIKYMVTRPVFNKLIKDKLEQPMVVHNSSAEYAAFLLGIQRALSVMERELVND